MGRTHASYIDQVAKGATPDQMDVYTVPEMTDVSVAFVGGNVGNYIHDVFGEVPVKLQTGKYRRYEPAEMLRNAMEQRADGAESVGTGFSTSLIDYQTHVWALHIDIGPQMRSNAAAGNVDVDTAATEELTEAALINREASWIAAYWKTGVWGSDVQFAAIPSGNQVLSLKDDDSDPIKTFLDMLETQRRAAAGKRATVGVFAEDVWRRLKVHPLLRTLWGGGQTPGGPTMGNPTVFMNQLREMLELEELRVGKAIYTTSEDGDPIATFDVMMTPGTLGFFYRPAKPSIMTAAAGYTFSWAGYAGAGENGQVVTRELIPLTKGAQRLEIEQAYGFGVVAKECGIFGYNVLN